MKTSLITIPLLAIALASCDKAKELAAKTSSAVKHQIAEKSGGEGSLKVDETLQKLVDQTPEGVIFRKDLPFPKRLEVKTKISQQMAVRFSQSSAIGRSTNTANGTLDTAIKLERNGDQVRYQLEQSNFSVPPVEDSKGEPQKTANPLEQGAPPTKSVSFHKVGKAWETDSSNNFHAVVLSRQLAPVLDELLIENALAPRSRWFGKRRLKIGTEFDVTGESLPMLVAGQSKGSIHLKLESLEAVEGHPCGVFSVTGDYSRKDFPDFEGNLSNEEISIQSGKLWLSLLYPVILKEELDTIQTFKSGGQGGLAGHGQGTIKLSVKRDWKVLAPIP